MSGSNKLVIAAAGSGKTRLLVKTALEKRDAKILITTYTQANEAEIRRKFIEFNRCVPENVVIQTWFSFLIQHGLRPFQGTMGLHDYKCRGLSMVNGRSAIYVPESNTEDHYFSSDGKVYSDKLAKFVVKSNSRSKGAVIHRLERIYTDIFIDEVQDFAGDDLELLRLLFKSSINILMVGDPRQGTYSTNNSAKNKKFQKADIVYFFEPYIEKKIVELDDDSLTVNYRCHPDICELANDLYPELCKSTAANSYMTGHDGIFFVSDMEIEQYLKDHEPMQLRDSKRTNVNTSYSVKNFGDAKGLTFDRVLIYPTKPILNWIRDKNSVLASTSRARLYVAITRARYSVAIVCDSSMKEISLKDTTQFHLQF